MAGRIVELAAVKVLWQAMEKITMERFLSLSIFH
jgi:hypothetical protein